MTLIFVSIGLFKASEELEDTFLCNRAKVGVLNEWEVVESGRISKERRRVRRAINFRTQSVTSLNQNKAPRLPKVPSGFSTCHFRNANQR
jgi:hypothetical protein